MQELWGAGVNDFTKEELKDLKRYARVYILQSPLLEKKNRPLADKIQSLIDNYCEHKESKVDCNGGISMVCVQCGYITMDI